MHANIRYKGATAIFIINDPEDHIQKQIIENKTFYEPDLIDFLFHIALPGMVFVDIGANIGNHTIFFSKILGGKVIAFEPSPESARSLRDNVSVNDCDALVTVYEVALSESEGKGVIIASDIHNSGANKVEIFHSGAITVSMLDSFNLDRVDIIKIDVEGSENSVILGARRTLMKHKPIVVAECHDVDSFFALSAQLSKLGYVPKLRFCVTPTYVFFPEYSRLGNLITYIKKLVP